MPTWVISARSRSGLPGFAWYFPASFSTIWARVPSSFAIPKPIENPFFLMAPSWALIPLVMLATLVTVIASQAVITGAFSIAQQAMSLGLLPRMNITHTSETEQGQIYIGQINWILLIGVILLVLVFRSSSNLASAYGVAVNTSMLIDTMLALVFFWKSRNLPPILVMPALAAIFLIEATFLAANGLKIAHGGYMPVLIGSTIILMMVTWMRGRAGTRGKTAPRID